MRANTPAGAPLPSQELVPTGRRQVPVNPGLRVTVLFTGLEATLAALRRAQQLASGLDANIVVIVPLVVPYQLPLAAPPVSPGFLVRNLCQAMGECANVGIRIYLCRDWRQVCRERIEPCSLVLIGGRRRWWPTQEERLARELRAAGHRTVLVEVS